MKNAAVIAWVEEQAALCWPDRVVWCDGSSAEQARLIRECLADGELLELDQKA